MLCIMMGVAAGAVAAHLLFDAGHTWILVSGVLGALLGLVLGSILMMWSEVSARRARGLPKLFHATTKVDISAAGISVEGLGLAAWGDLLGFERVPDSETYLMVHTRQFENLMLDAPTELLIPLLTYHMDRPPGQGTNAVAGSLAPDVIRCKAVVFHWPAFMAWIWAGYLVAAAVGVAMLTVPEAERAQNVGLMMFVLPATAWLVWAIPFTQLGMFAARRVRWFELSDARLRSTDGTWDLDLQHVKVRHRRSSGAGFALDFLSLRPATGRGLDILVDTCDARAMLDAIVKRKLIDKVAS